MYNALLLLWVTLIVTTQNWKAVAPTKMKNFFYNGQKLKIWRSSVETRFARLDGTEITAPTYSRDRTEITASYVSKDEKGKGNPLLLTFIIFLSDF